MKITIIGAGYVGVVTGVGLAQAGHSVTCVDQDKLRVGVINGGHAPFHEPGLDELLQEQLAASRLVASTSLKDGMRGSDVSIIAVGTPAREGGIDLSFVRNAARDVGRQLAKLRGYHVVVVKSTVVPSTTDTVVRAELEAASGMICGIDFGLAVNPEFLSEGRAVADFIAPDRIVIGTDYPRARVVLAQMYGSFSCPVVHTTPRNAEMIKYTANALQATLISFSNEIAGICEAVRGLDEESVMRGVHLDRCWSAPTAAQGTLARAVSYLRAGVGFGGSCFPKDLKALRSFAHQEGVAVPIVDAVIRVNDERPGRVVNLLVDCLGTLAGRRIAVLGLAFKPDTDDVRESPGVRIAKFLLRRRAKVVVHDPLVRIGAVVDQLGPGVRQAADVCTAATGADALVIATGWQAYRDIDWADIVPRMRSPVILDGRQVVSATSLPSAAKLVSTGRCPEVLPSDGGKTRKPIGNVEAGRAFH
jgi:UDPglucose 6-dehydrogenase